MDSPRGSALRAADVMTPRPATVRPYATVKAALAVMRAPVRPGDPAPGETVRPELSLWGCAARLARRGVRELQVVQEGRLIGIIRRTDIVSALAERGGPD